jgi:hypothetical protein
MHLKHKLPDRFASEGGKIGIHLPEGNSYILIFVFGLSGRDQKPYPRLLIHGNPVKPEAIKHNGIAYLLTSGFPK